ncbi:amidophosphoribosyltransferase [Alkaliphilus metalliredigens QYMF]|uniref:Amidophosphoribosyltransferase n=2 Tax=Alkaliphilus TaxID=114627 RepID=A6TLS4_ALKMQ|nr:amidophosphoribosyltransferase [Alkaliphilus metalliredigens QYMF]
MFNGVHEDRLREECGVIGIFNRDEKHLAKQLYYGLYALQHRGQESAGIATTDGKQTRCHKGMGLVPEVFNEEDLKRLPGTIGIGHVRYSTAGESQAVNAQPLVAKYRGGSIALAHNGNLVNAALLRKKLEEDGVIFQTTIDSEVIVNLIARYSRDGIVEAIERTMDLIKGAYALVMMTDKSLIGVRDPLGLRPLCLGKKDEGYVLASESCALETIGATLIRDIEPGEMVLINGDQVESHRIAKEKSRASCIFEYVYFARPDSQIDGVHVYEARIETGKMLAKEHPVEADIVIAVPDSSIAAALGYSKASGIPFVEGLIKNRYVGRTFIQPDQATREAAVNLKLSPVRSNIQGKRIILVDDSIVRGTTSQRIVRMLKNAGAKEVHMRISSPPVAYSCYFGIDTPDREKLVGATHTVDEICRKIGADSLRYISVEGLVQATGLPKEHFCLACFNGRYPIEVPESSNEKMFKRWEGDGNA